MMTKKKFFGRKEGTEKVKGRVLIVENEGSKEGIMNSENPLDRDCACTNEIIRVLPQRKKGNVVKIEIDIFLVVHNTSGVLM